MFPLAQLVQRIREYAQSARGNTNLIASKKKNRVSSRASERTAGLWKGPEVSNKMCISSNSSITLCT